MSGTAQQVSSAARAGRAANNPLPEADAYTFRAPRHGDLVVCPYCGPDTFVCDHCGGEGKLFASEVFGRCDNPQPLPIDGPGGKPASPDKSPLSMGASLTPGSSRSAAFPTASGRPDPSSQPASGGSRANSILKPGSFSPLKSSAPKSMAGAQTLGELGHG